MPTKTTKTTKQELKAILKQCLREILKEEGVLLSEGLRPPGASFGGKNRRPAAPDLQQPSATPPEQIQNSALMNQVNGLAESFGNKGAKEADMFRNILADTAATTLQEQQGAGHSVGAEGGSGEMPGVGGGNFAMPTTPQKVAQDQSELASLSHDGDVSRWAQVAFAGKQGN